jgi:hypothetical protein
VLVFTKTMGNFVKCLLTNADNTVYLGIPWRKFMSPTVQQKVQDLIDKYFIGQNNYELSIKQDNLNKFLSEYNTIIITRTVEVCGLH